MSLPRLSPYQQAIADFNQRHPDQAEDYESSIEVRFAAYPSWFTTYGVYLKQMHLRAEGFPMCENWMMVTLTIDQNLFSDPEAAFDYLLDTKNSGKNSRVAKFTNDLAKLLKKWGYFIESTHCVNWRKLEFQSNGWPHWHVFTNILKRLTKPQLKQACALWKFGRIRFDKLDSNAHYAFKYAFKCPFKKTKFNPDGSITIEEHELNSAVPEWFANKYEILDGKPFSYDRARFFQRSRSFMKNHQAWRRSLGLNGGTYKVLKPVEPQAPSSSLRVVTVKERLATHLSKIQLIARGSDGEYIKSVTAQLTKPFHLFLEQDIVPRIIRGECVSAIPNHYTLKEIPAGSITPLSQYKQKEICYLNQLTISGARKVQSSIQNMISAESPSSGKSYQLQPLKTGSQMTKKRSSEKPLHLD